MTTGLFLLRCIQAGIPLSDLDMLSVGMVYDILTESRNDGEEYEHIATQDDFDRF